MRTSGVKALIKPGDCKVTSGSCEMEKEGILEGSERRKLICEGYNTQMQKTGPE